MKVGLALVIACIGMASAAVPCGKQILDFDSFGEWRGQYLPFNFYQNTMGIDYIACQSAPVGVGHCRIFDTNIPVGQWPQNGRGPCNCGPLSQGYPKLCWDANSCGDPDLNPPGQNLDHVLIIDECQDTTDPPDDFDGGGCFIFKFSQAVTVHSIAFLDTEECTRPDVKVRVACGVGAAASHNQCKPTCFNSLFAGMGKKLLMDHTRLTMATLSKHSIERTFESCVHVFMDLVPLGGFLSQEVSVR